jgi:hypothetical protein
MSVTPLVIFKANQSACIGDAKTNNVEKIFK